MFRAMRTGKTPAGHSAGRVNAVRAAWVVLLGVAGLHASAAGQVPEDLPRAYAGVAAAVAQPLGEFDDYVNVGGGLDGFLRVRLDAAGIVSLRIHAGFLTYGNETRRVCLSETVGCRIEVDLTTSNNILLLGVGPEVGVPLGPVRLYGNGSVSLDYFSTDSNVSGTSSGEPFAGTRNYSDGGFAWNAGGGMEVEVARARNLPISLDLGLSYQGNGRREYLTRGGIIDRPDGSLEFDVKRSEADFLLWRIGASVGLRGQER